MRCSLCTYTLEKHLVYLLFEPLSPMRMSTRKVLIQRLEDLGEFGERLNDSSMTQYKRKQALKENLPADFVTGFVITAGVGFLFAGGYRIYRLANDSRRMEIYTVLHELDKASEDSAASASAEPNVSTQDREFAPASAAA